MSAKKISLAQERVALQEENNAAVKEAFETLGLPAAGIHYLALCDRCRRMTTDEEVQETVKKYVSEKMRKPKNSSSCSIKSKLKSDIIPAALNQHQHQSNGHQLSPHTKITESNDDFGDAARLQQVEDFKLSLRTLESSTPESSESIKKLVRNIVGNGLRVKYCGAVGTSGYASAAKSYLYSLFLCGTEIVFEPIMVHSCVERNDSIRDQVLRQHLGRNLKADVVILHSVPQLWPKLAKQERSVNPNVKLVGLTVWESSRICPAWQQHMKCVDLIISACEWNRYVFERDAQKPSICIPTPFEPETFSSALSPEFRMDVQPNQIVFYTIGEWNNRKGMEDTIKCFVETFDGCTNVVLYIKCCHIEPSVAMHFVSQQRTKPSAPQVLIDARKLLDSEVAALHKRGDVYVSLCRSEATGLGALEALSMGKPVVMTAYGGQLQYLKSGVFWVSFHEETPIMCTRLRPGHDRCSPKQGICNVYPWFQPNQCWGRPNLEDAKLTMRFVYDNLEACRKQAVLGQKYASEHFTYEMIGRQMTAALWKVVLSK